jgi:hypothetical protein
MRDLRRITAAFTDPLVARRDRLHVHCQQAINAVAERPLLQGLLIDLTRRLDA